MIDVYCDQLEATPLTKSEEVEKLREAIKNAGFGIMQTSGVWSIHDVSEHHKKDQERTQEVIMYNIELEIAARKLRILCFEHGIDTSDIEWPEAPAFLSS